MSNHLGLIPKKVLGEELKEFIDTLGIAGSGYGYNLYDAIYSTWLVARDNAIKGRFLTKVVPPKIREEILIKYEGKCAYCGKSDKLSIHHKLPIRFGGDNSIDNLELVCGSSEKDSCHRQRAKHLLAWTDVEKKERLAKYMKKLWK